MRLIPLAVLAATLACIACSGVSAQDSGFAAWLSAFRQQAAGAGISDSIMDKAFAGVQPIDRVLELDQSQPESVLTLPEYVAQVVNKKMVAQARAAYHENRALLGKISEQYGVQPQYIIALWGIETHYGHNMGGFSTVAALATLAYDGRRSDYFRGELLNALIILQQGHITPGAMRGSWAGAMGQCQFMPSSFLKYAVDYNGDGRKDIWGTRADVFASIANYLHSEGWNPRQGLGTAAQAGSNFNILLKWNKSSYFVTAVGRLADDAVQEKPKAKTKARRKK